MDVWAPIPPRMVKPLKRYMSCVLASSLNLTSIRNEEEFVTRHFADSLALLPLLPPGKFRLLDVGTGGGFPGLVLKIARPEIELSLLDGTRKKLIFLAELAANLGIEAVTIHGRAEELVRSGKHGRYDIVTARAVAALPKLCRLCLPFVKPGGHFLAMKGSRWREEWESAQGIPEKFGAKWLLSYEYVLALPGGDAPFAVCVAQTEKEP